MGISMDFNIPPKMDFPVANLGPILSPACEAISQIAQVPPEMAAQSLLAYSALAVQQHYNVQLDYMLYPTSLFFLTCAESGDRKSTSDKIAAQPIQEFERELVTQHRDVNFLESNEPNASPMLTCSEPTIEGLHRQLESGRPSLGLFSDEAGQFFGGYSMSKDHCMKSISGLSTIWDGNPISRVRVGESYVIHDRRLSAHLMLQPVLLEPMIRNAMLMQQGFFARFLMCEPESLAGSRMYTTNQGTEDRRLQPYYLRLKELISSEIETNELSGLNLKIMQVSKAAKATWIEFNNETEQALCPGGLLESIKPAASKMPQQVLRLSAVLAALDGQDSVCESHMQNAVELGSFYLNSAIRIQFRSECSAFESNVASLLDWLKSQSKPITMKLLQTCSPRRLKLRSSADMIREVMSNLTSSGDVVATKKDASGNDCEWEITA